MATRSTLFKSEARFRRIIAYPTVQGCHSSVHPFDGLETVQSGDSNRLDDRFPLRVATVRPWQFQPIRSQHGIRWWLLLLQSSQYRSFEFHASSLFAIQPVFVLITCYPSTRSRLYSDLLYIRITIIYICDHGKCTRNLLSSWTSTTVTGRRYASSLFSGAFSFDIYFGVIGNILGPNSFGRNIKAVTWSKKVMLQQEKNDRGSEGDGDLRGSNKRLNNNSCRFAVCIFLDRTRRHSTYSRLGRINIERRRAYYMPTDHSESLKSASKRPHLSFQFLWYPRLEKFPTTSAIKSGERRCNQC